MAQLGGFVPEVGQEVLILNHLGIYRVSEIDSLNRTVNVTVLRSGAALERIPWDQLMRLGQAIESLNSAFPEGTQKRKEVQEFFHRRFREKSGEGCDGPEK
jgi:hypothetical protein